METLILLATAHELMLANKKASEAIKKIHLDLCVGLANQYIFELGHLGDFTQEELTLMSNYVNKITAIKMIRNRTGCSLLDAKNKVEGWMLKHNVKPTNY